MKVKEVYKHFIKIEYNDGVQDIQNGFTYYSTEFMNNDEFKECLKEIEEKIDCPKYRVIKFLAERVKL